MSSDAGNNSVPRRHGRYSRYVIVPITATILGSLLFYGRPKNRVSYTEDIAELVSAATERNLPLGALDEVYYSYYDYYTPYYGSTNMLVGYPSAYQINRLAQCAYQMSKAYQFNVSPDKLAGAVLIGRADYDYLSLFTVGAYPEWYQYPPGYAGGEPVLRLKTQFAAYDDMIPGIYAGGLNAKPYTNLWERVLGTTNCLEDLFPDVYTDTGSRPWYYYKDTSPIISRSLESDEMENILVKLSSVLTNMTHIVLPLSSVATNVHVRYSQRSSKLYKEVTPGSVGRLAYVTSNSVVVVTNTYSHSYDYSPGQVRFMCPYPGVYVEDPPPWEGDGPFNGVGWISRVSNNRTYTTLEYYKTWVNDEPQWRPVPGAQPETTVTSTDSGTLSYAVLHTFYTYPTKYRLRIPLSSLGVATYNYTNNVKSIDIYCRINITDFIWRNRYNNFGEVKHYLSPFSWWGGNQLPDGSWPDIAEEVTLNSYSPRFVTDAINTVMDLIFGNDPAERRSECNLPGEWYATSATDKLSNHINGSGAGYDSNWEVLDAGTFAAYTRHLGGDDERVPLIMVYKLATFDEFPVDNIFEVSTYPLQSFSLSLESLMHMRDNYTYSHDWNSGGEVYHVDESGRMGWEVVQDKRDIVFDEAYMPATFSIEFSQRSFFAVINYEFEHLNPEKPYVSELVDTVYTPPTVDKVYLSYAHIYTGSVTNLRVTGILAAPNKSHVDLNIPVSYKYNSKQSLDITEISLRSVDYNDYRVVSVTCNGVKTIGAESFKNQADLTSVYAKSCTRIGKYAFSGCSSLNLVMLGSIAPAYEPGIFAGAPLNLKVRVPRGAVGYGEYMDGRKVEEID